MTTPSYSMSTDYVTSYVNYDRRSASSELLRRIESLPEEDYQSRVRILRGNQFVYTAGRAVDMRMDLVRKYGFAIPNGEALRVLSSIGPIVEMGAGAGYWSYLLRKRGVDVQVYDKAPPRGKKNPYKFSKEWTPVLEGRPRKLKKRADRALFLCWPDYDSPFAYDCLRKYTGDTLAYVGEGSGGCTGDENFFDLLDREWVLVREVSIPQWNGIHDELALYRRK